MLTLTYEDGRQVERRFCGSIATEGDIERFVAELRRELQANEVPIFCEIWGELQKAKKEVIKSWRKKVLAS